MGLVAFEVVKKVLLRAEPRARSAHGKNIDAKVSSTLIDLGSKYSRLASSRKPIIDYSDPATHVAYLYGYVPAHAAFVYRVLLEGRMAASGPLFKGETLRVTSLGGGPGSDLLGLLKYLSRPFAKEPVKRVRIRVLDREDAWKQVCADLVAEAASIGVKIDLTFEQIDVTDPKAAKRVDWSSEDLVAMSFFVSEVSCLDEKKEVKSFFEGAFGDLKDGCLVLYNDNRDSAFRDFLDASLKAAGKFESIVEDDAADMRLDNDEQASVLGAFKVRFGGRSTKLTGRTSYRLVRKQ